MDEPLIVDPARLHAAGRRLSEVQFPVPPPSAVPVGTDPVSAAVGETLPIIEAPVLEDLPKVKAAVQRSASSILAAARLYADTDGRLGAFVTLNLAETPATMDGRPVAAPPALNVPPSARPDDATQPESTPRLDEIVEVAAMGEQGMQQGVQYLTQGMQAVQGSLRRGAAGPAALASKSIEPVTEIESGEQAAAPAETSEGAAAGADARQAVTARTGIPPVPSAPSPSPSQPSR